MQAFFKHWKDELKENRLPNNQSLEKLRHTTKLTNIKFKDSRTLYKENDIELDLCGIIKGYAVDQIFEYITSLGFKDVMVSWSGETRSVGYAKNQKPFNIGLQGDIRIPTPHHVYAIICDANDSAIATSGDSEHLWPYYGEDGIDYYTHTVHPHSLRLKKVTNSSVNLSVCQSASCMISDIIATCSVLIDDDTEFDLWLNDLRVEFPDIQVLRFSRTKTPQVDLSPRSSLEKYNENIIQSYAS
ncbi:FAD:protein FMN transferase [Chlamydiia bacterium]|nr:FAD:protein FMN transferase [Chlamydiia bacterium]